MCAYGNKKRELALAPRYAGWDVFPCPTPEPQFFLPLTNNLLEVYSYLLNAISV